ncbi:MAG: collagen binding domain-containing protein, partial [Candidatus Cryptobacteroides sp.]
MKHLKLILSCAAMLTLAATSCQKEQKPQEVQTGTVTGTVTDNLYNPIVDVAVSVKGTALLAATAADGSFTLENVPMEKQTILFTKEGFAQASATVTAASFKDGVANVNVQMEIGNAQITGRCLDARNGNVPLQGVTVKLNGAQSTTTGEDGTYTFTDLTVNDYELLFQKEGCVDVTIQISADQFAGDYIVKVQDVRIGGKEILRGATLEDILKADVWHYNEYRGGKNGNDYP